MSYTVHQAKTNLSRLIKEAESGKEVIITRGKERVAKMIPEAEGKTKRVPGRLKHLISWEPDAFAPLTDEEMRERLGVGMIAPAMKQRSGFGVRR